MPFRWPAFLLSLGGLFPPDTSDSLRKYELQAASDFLFYRRPSRSEYSDRTPVQQMKPRGQIVASSRAPYRRTQSETLTFSRADVPALTITADPSNMVEVSGNNQSDWSLRFCAQGEGNTESEASERLQRISISRLGSTVSLNGAGLGQLLGAMGQLSAKAPADAPVVIHACFA